MYLIRFMNIQKQERDQELTQFIESIVKIPDWVKYYGLNHHSPSQLNKIDGAWSYEYLFLTQEQRRNLPGNSKMFAGIQVGNAAQADYGTYAWERNKKIEIKRQKKAVERMLQYFNSYLPVDDRDREQHEINKQGLALIYDQFRMAFKMVGLKEPIECERTVTFELPGCQLPCIGRIDFEDANNFIELKTKWKKRGKPKNDGTTSYSLQNISYGYLGWREHLLQIAFYWLATKKKPHLVVINENKFNVFTPDNCEDLKPKNLEKFLNVMAIVAKRRERLMERHAGKNTFTLDVEPTFNHPYFWNYGGNHKQEAMKLWGIK